jgi:hypothetical protein
MRHFHAIGHPTMTAANDTAWAALLFGAIDLRDDPLPDEFTCSTCGDRDCLGACEAAPSCEVCGGTGTLTRTVGLGPESKPCWECQKEWW